MKGPYDDELPWPLKGNFQVKLLNQINDNSHHAVTRSADIDHNVNMLISNDSTTKRYGIYSPQFIKITPMLYLQSNYFKNDSLIFEASKHE